MIALLDVNLLVALAWPGHVSFATVHRWFARHGDAGWATCPITQAGFVRVLFESRVFIPRGQSRGSAGSLGKERHASRPSVLGRLDFTAASP